mmetsp:Transcript_23212/g.59676  ORF Transcript_23212/g.59676 Transcript_23212/m.59676 type:complete len:233 (+) Transcript_23212:248-946(+)
MCAACAPRVGCEPTSRLSSSSTSESAPGSTATRRAAGRRIERSRLERGWNVRMSTAVAVMHACSAPMASATMVAYHSGVSSPSHAISAPAVGAVPTTPLPLEPEPEPEPASVLAAAWPIGSAHTAPTSHHTHMTGRSTSTRTQSSANSHAPASSGKRIRCAGLRLATVVEDSSCMHTPPSHSEPCTSSHSPSGRSHASAAPSANRSPTHAAPTPTCAYVRTSASTALRGLLV